MKYEDRRPAQSAESARAGARRHMLIIGVLALAPVLLSGTARGQQASKAKAQQAAKSWLGLIDAGNYRQSWGEVAQYLKQKITRAQWVAQLQQVRAPLGAVKSRKLASVQLRDNLRGLPAGQYAAVRYTTAFAKTPPAAEVVALMLENGQWRVVAYFPQAHIKGPAK
jgi:hypothetical protein